MYNRGSWNARLDITVGYRLQVLPTLVLVSTKYSNWEQGSPDSLKT